MPQIEQLAGGKPMKLCIDCRWIMPPVNRDSPCGHPQAVWRDQSPVTGKTVEYHWDCASFRMAGGFPARCGPEGKLWEPRVEPQAVADRGFE